MPRRSLAPIFPEPEVAQKPVTRHKPRTKKYIISKPLTAEQISQGVAVTKKDAALVTKVLLRLGYIKKEDEPARTTRTAAVKKGKTSTKKL